MPSNAKIGIIGGTGLYRIDGLEILETRVAQTPFGAPSAPLVIGKLAGREVVFLPRHGTQHQLLPSEINYRANLWALKEAGARRIISVSATGSLRQEIAPGDLAIPSQYFDFTKGRRASTFFGEGLVAHVSTAEPACPVLASRIEAAARRREIRIHSGKTYACVEGPRLGSRAESFFLRGAGCDLVGMTNVPEVFLAREAQLCYCTIAIATDYDCWLDDPSQHATVEKVMELYMKNLGRVKDILVETLSAEESGSCGCRASLAGAVMTPESALSSEKKRVLEFLRQ